MLGTTDVPAATTSLILHLVHALGGGLVGIGIASFALVHFVLTAIGVTLLVAAER